MSLSKEKLYKIKTLEQKISQGDLDAMMKYAEFFERHTEDITDKIAQKMVKCYETCLAEGNLTAALNLGAMYYCGEFIPRDFKKAKTFGKIKLKQKPKGYAYVRNILPQDNR